MNRLSIRASIIALGLLASCDAKENDESVPGRVDVQERTQALGVTGGEVPIPIKADGTSAWDGVYAELLAADALALCWESQSAGARATYPRPSSDPDKLVAWLYAKMSTAMRTAAGTNTQTDYDAWVASRQNATYNADVSTGAQKAVNLTVTRTASADYVIPATASLGIPAGTAAETARTSAQLYAANADLALCMAAKLREQLDSSFIAFASDAEVRRLLELAQERALTAVVNYSVLAKAFSATNLLGTDWTVNNGNMAVIPLRRWRDTMTTTVSQRLGSDFATAIQLLVETTEKRANVLLRSPNAQASFGTYDATGETVVGDRMDLLVALYGQIARSYVEPIKRKAVTVSMSDPNVQVLLGLARKANALDIDVASDSVNITTNAQNLLSKVEASQRQARCIDDGNLTPGCYAVGADPIENYLIYKEHGISAAHAETLVKAFLEVMFGRPPTTGITTSTWSYGNNMFGPQTAKWRSRTFAFHLLGQLTYSGSLTTSPSSGTIHIAKDFDFSPPSSEELQLGGMWLEQIPLRTFEVRQHPKQLGMNFRSAWANITMPQREVGAVAAMVLARESAVQMVGTQFYNNVKPALRLIDAAIGPRSATVRAKYTSQSGASQAACTDWTDAGVTPSSCTNLFRGTGTLLGYDFASFTYPADTATSVRYGLSKRNMISAALDPKFVSFDGASQTTLPTDLPTKPSLSTVTQDGRQTRTASFNLNWNDYMGSSIFLSSTVSGQEFLEPVQSFSFGNDTSPLAALIVSYGGSLNAVAQRAWEPDRLDWSKPRYDAFGLPIDWVPAPDASLSGGSQSQESYDYWLEVARSASEDATAAIQNAFQLMISEQQDTTALALTEAKSANLSLLVRQELCGFGTQCDASMTTVPTVLPTCVNTTNTACTSLRNMALKIVPPSFTLLSVVANQLGRPSPDFSNVAGGKLEQVALRQWAAMRSLMATYEAAVRAADANAAAIAVAGLDVTAAAAERDALVADVQQAYVNLWSSDVEIRLELDEIKNRWDADWITTDLALQTAEANKETYCGNAARDAAEESSITGGAKWSWVEWKDDGTGTGNKVPVRRTKSSGSTQYTGSVNVGPIYAYLEKCELAKTALAEAQRREELVQHQQRDRTHYLETQLLAHAMAAKGLQARYEAIQPKYVAAVGRSIATVLQTYSGWASQAVQLQASVNAALETLADVDQVLNAAYIEVQRNNLDTALSTVDIYSRFAVRRRYQSYDLWRARALSENARRLAVSARRAIEARFALNLSEMTADEPFVDAPRLWADDVYDNDLRPPAALGTTSAPTAGGGLYANKLRDYVRNLESFVQGYVVARPSTKAMADSEVIHLPGPAAMLHTTGDQVSVSYVDPESLSWTFYCAGSASWIRYPTTTQSIPPAVAPGNLNATQFAPGNLDTACAGGTRPTKARLTFALDPWGQVGRNGGGIVTYGERYNARWSRLAVNLVGTGIRNCEASSDPTSCYSQPFVRYDLRHAGPGEVTDYEMTRRAIPMPTAIIEGGKALAIEEWLDPVSHGWNVPEVQASTRYELAGRPLGGGYELILDITPDLDIEEIERIQLLVMNDYWVRQKQ